MNIIIPKLISVELYGYEPIFKQVVNIDIQNDLHIILGGNGLGKTTILQSIVFALAGSANENIEQDKNKRWGRNYFRDRLEEPNDAYIIVGFYLGDWLIHLKRGFYSDKVIEFWLDGESINNGDADKSFEEFLINNTGYNNLEEYNFIIHKLCYLSESRENLAWDLEAQTRILMQIFSDVLTESKFRKQRGDIKLLDSKIRHKTVDVNWLNNKITFLNQPTIEKENLPLIVDVAPNSDKDLSNIQLQDDLIKINNQISSNRNNLKRLKKEHEHIVEEIDELRSNLAIQEHAFFFDTLNQITTNESKLAIYKLLHYKLCPCCGNTSIPLYDRAIEFIKDENCPLCGTDQKTSSEIMPGLEAELGEKLIQKINIEKELIKIEKDLDRQEEIAGELNLEVNNVLLSRTPSVIYINKSRDTNSTNEDKLTLIEAYENLLAERNDLQIQFDALKKQVDTEYEDFNSFNNSRIQELHTLYSKYANEFLGIPCTLEPITIDDRLTTLNLLVPRFNNITRTNPSSCSEAQRFFLDIAFRLALIDLANSLVNFKGSFICETPENALDITYINNVADMFEIFSRHNKNTLIMTSNIQSGGIAQSLLSKIKGQDKNSYILNLIRIGNLSEVQGSEVGRDLLEKEIQKILE